MADRHISTALKLQEKALEALKKTNPEDIDPKDLLAFIREATKLERNTCAEIVRETDPMKDEDKHGSSLADVIAEAQETSTDADARFAENNAERLSLEPAARAQRTASGT